MRLPQIFIVVAMFSIAFFPQFYFEQTFIIIKSIFASQVSQNTFVAAHTATDLTAIGQLSFFFIILLGVLFLLRSAIVRKRTQRTYETWGCGYIAPIANAQYTGRSYARTFGNLLSFVVSQRKNFLKIPKSQLYPGYRKFSTYYFDILEKKIVSPLIKRLTFVLNYFQFIQNGKIQSYVIYGLVFILIVFIGTVINLIK
jgi:hypothetical protein